MTPSVRFGVTVDTLSCGLSVLGQAWHSMGICRRTFTRVHRAARRRSVYLAHLLLSRELTALMMKACQEKEC